MGCAQGSELEPIRGHSDWVTSIAICPKRNLLAATAGNLLSNWLDSKGFNYAVRVWDISHDQQAVSIAKHASDLTAISVDASGNRIASADETGEIHLTRIADGKRLQTFTGHQGAVNCLSFSPNGLTLASGGKDKSIRIWDTETGEAVHVIKDNSSSITSLSYHPSGKSLASSGTDKFVSIWDSATGEKSLTLFANSLNESRIEFIQNGERLIRIAKGSSFQSIVQGAIEVSKRIPAEIRVWDATNGKRIEVPIEVKGWIQAVAMSRSGKTLAIAEDDVIKLIDIDNWQIRTTLRGHDGPIRSLAFGANDAKLAASSERNVKIGTCKVDRKQSP